MRDAATLIVRVLSGGRRAQAELLADAETPPHTDLRTVVVPAASARRSARLLTVMLGLQASPTKELVAALRWTDERRRVRAALQWVEGEHAVRWLRATWPGLGSVCEEQFPAIDDAALPDDPESLLAQARERARRAPPQPPFLFGILPAPGAHIRLRPTNIGSRFSDRRRLPRRGVLSAPASGPDGAPVRHEGEAGEIEALVGRARNIGIPYDEWDARAGEYRRDYAWVQERIAVATSPFADGERLALPRLTPSRGRQRHAESGELDVDALIDWRCALATGAARDDARLFAELLPARRATAFALLLDVSASSLQDGGQSFARGLVHANALAATLSAAGHAVGAFAFRSSSHERIELLVLQAFGRPYEPFGGRLRPSGYTRFGAAIRHAGARLLEQPADAHVLICLGDALPADEGYDGAYGRGDVAQAVRELASRGTIVRHLTPRERGAQDLDEMFGAGGWQPATSTADLSAALDSIADQVRRCPA